MSGPGNRIPVLGGNSLQQALLTQRATGPKLAKEETLIGGIQDKAGHLQNLIQLVKVTLRNEGE